MAPEFSPSTEFHPKHVTPWQASSSGSYTSGMSNKQGHPIWTENYKIPPVRTLNIWSSPTSVGSPCKPSAETCSRPCQPRIGDIQNMKTALRRLQYVSTYYGSDYNTGPCLNVAHAGSSKTGQVLQLKTTQLPLKKVYAPPNRSQKTRIRPFRRHMVYMYNTYA